MDINTALVRRMVASQFPEWAGLSVETVDPGGWDNRTFRLGKEMSVRLPSAAMYAEQVEKEQQWLPALAPHLPLPVPVPLAMGRPDADYPFNWSIYRWIEGACASRQLIGDLSRFARDLGLFLAALHRIDPEGGPPPGRPNFFRGGALTTYDHEARSALAALRDVINTGAATTVWNAALDSQWKGPPVWVHGDVSPGNLLVSVGRLSAVIDFGCTAVGDPACDLAMAWTLFSGESRHAFRAALPLDADTWNRGRGWALWKALITLAEHLGTDTQKADAAKRSIHAVLADLGNPRLHHRRPAEVHPGEMVRRS